MISLLQNLPIGSPGTDRDSIDSPFLLDEIVPERPALDCGFHRFLGRNALSHSPYLKRRFIWRHLWDYSGNSYYPRSPTELNRHPSGTCLHLHPWINTSRGSLAIFAEAHQSANADFGLWQSPGQIMGSRDLRRSGTIT